MYTPDRNLDPPIENDIDNVELCQDCNEPSNDMRYTGLDYQGKLFNPICPVCQQIRIVEKLETKLLKAKSKLNTLKLKP